MPIRDLLTIGYEGASIEGFLATLVGLRVNTVVDVRELPLSRKKGFSKSRLTLALAGVGITYRHERSLGCPPAIRARLKSTGDYRRYFADFNKYLATKTDVVESMVIDLRGRVVLLCYERNVEYCHRQSVAELIKERFALSPRHVAIPA